MDMLRAVRGCALAVALAVASTFLYSGCGSDSSGTPSTVSPEMEKKTQDMLKNKSQQYNDRYKKNGGKPG